MRMVLNKMYVCARCIVVVVRWHGKAAEHRVCLDFFTPLFLSRKKVENKLL